MYAINLLINFLIADFNEQHTTEKIDVISYEDIGRGKETLIDISAAIDISHSNNLSVSDLIAFQQSLSMPSTSSTTPFDFPTESVEESSEVLLKDVVNVLFGRNNYRDNDSNADGSSIKSDLSYEDDEVYDTPDTDSNISGELDSKINQGSRSNIDKESNIAHNDDKKRKFTPVEHPTRKRQCHPENWEKKQTKIGRQQRKSIHFIVHQKNCSRKINEERLRSRLPFQMRTKSHGTFQNSVL